MLHALSAATSALDLLKSLTASKSQSAGNKQDPKSPFDLSGSNTASEGSPARSGAGGGSQISPATMSALLAALSQSTTESEKSASASRSDPLKDLFSQIDADSDGKLGKSEFEDALGAGGTNLAQAQSVFGKLDRNGDGSVSLGEMASALRSKGHQHDVAGADGTAGSGAPDAAGTDPLTSAAASSAAASSYNFTEQMIQRQAKAISSAATASLSLSA
jgi:hypothetical protein